MGVISGVIYVIISVTFAILFAIGIVLGTDTVNDFFELGNQSPAKKEIFGGRLKI